jgi:hypothetical protein
MCENQLLDCRFDRTGDCRFDRTGDCRFDRTGDFAIVFHILCWFVILGGPRIPVQRETNISSLHFAHQIYIVGALCARSTTLYPTFVHQEINNTTNSMTKIYRYILRAPQGRKVLSSSYQKIQFAKKLITFAIVFFKKNFKEL